MAYDQDLEAKLDNAVKGWKSVAKKKMFGGVCYLLNGNMAFGIWKDNLIVRMDKEQGAQSLQEKNVKPFDITGRAMAGWVMVEQAGWKTARGLARWTGIGREFARSLPAKDTTGGKKIRTLREYRQ